MQPLLQKSLLQPDRSGFAVRQVFIVQSTDTWHFLAADLSFVGNFSCAGRLMDWHEAFQVGHDHMGEDFLIHAFHELTQLGSEDGDLSEFF